MFIIRNKYHFRAENVAHRQNTCLSCARPWDECPALKNESKIEFLKHTTFLRRKFCIRSRREVAPSRQLMRSPCLCEKVPPKHPASFLGGIQCFHYLLLCPCIRKACSPHGQWSCGYLLSSPLFTSPIGVEGSQGD